MRQGQRGGMSSKQRGKLARWRFIHLGGLASRRVADRRREGRIDPDRERRSGGGRGRRDARFVPAGTRLGAKSETATRRRRHQVDLAMLNIGNMKPSGRLSAESRRQGKWITWKLGELARGDQWGLIPWLMANKWAWRQCEGVNEAPCPTWSPCECGDLANGFQRGLVNGFLGTKVTCFTGDQGN